VALGIFAIFVGGFIGMLVARRWVLLYSVVLAVVPLSVVYAAQAIRHGDPLLGALAANFRQFSLTFVVVLAGAAAAFTISKRQSKTLEHIK